MKPEGDPLEEMIVGPSEVADLALEIFDLREELWNAERELYCARQALGVVMKQYGPKIGTDEA